MADNPFLKYLTPEQASQFAKPAAPAQAAPMPSGGTASASNVQATINDYKRKAALYQAAGNNASSAFYAKAATELESQASKGMIWTGQGYAVAPGYNEGVAGTAAAEATGRKMAEQPFVQQNAQFESDLCGDEAEKKALRDRAAKIGEVGLQFSEKWEANPAFKNMAAAQTFRNNAENDYKAGTTIGDLNLVLAFYKTVDPTSTVTGNEAETAAAQKALMDRANAYLERQTNGALPQKARDEMMKTIHGNYMSVYEQQYKPALTQLRKYAGFQGVENISDAIRDPYNVDDPDNSRIFKPIVSAEEKAAEEQRKAMAAAVTNPADVPQAAPAPAAAPTGLLSSIRGAPYSDVEQGPGAPPAMPRKTGGLLKAPLGTGAQEPAAPVAAPAAAGMPTVSGPDDPAFKTLGSGAQFIWNGKVKTKK